MCSLPKERVQIRGISIPEERVMVLIIPNMASFLDGWHLGLAWKDVEGEKHILVKGNSINKVREAGM